MTRLINYLITNILWQSKTTTVTHTKIQGQAIATDLQVNQVNQSHHVAFVCGIKETN